jgi:hypothetical protein
MLMDISSKKLKGRMTQEVISYAPKKTGLTVMVG